MLKMVKPTHDERFIAELTINHERDDNQRDPLQRMEPILDRGRPRGIKVDPNEFAMALVDQHSRSLALDRYATLRLHGGFGAS